MLKARFCKLICTLWLAMVMAGCVTNPILGPSAEDELSAGIALFEQGQFGQAIERLKHALELDPELTEAYLYIGRAYFNEGRYLEAVSYSRNAYINLPVDRRKEVASTFLDSLLKGGIGLFKKGDYTNSIALLKEAVQVAPGSSAARGELVDVLVSHGTTLLKEGRFNDALEAFSESLSFAPDNLESYLGMAKAFFQKGDFSKALQSFKQVLQAAPNNAEARTLFQNILSGG